MTAVDDLKPGMWVAVTGRIQHEQPTYSEFPFFSAGRSREQFDGFPLKIIAISLPFICVQRGSGMASIDVRQFKLQRMSKQYVQAAADFEPALKVKRKRRKREKPDPKQCPRCGQRIVERRVISADPNKQSWFLVCSGCGLDQGPVKATD